MQTWEQTVERCAAQRWDAAPAEVRRRAALLVADTVGAMLAGARVGAVAALERGLLESSGPSPARGAPLLTLDATTAPEPAAFAYGTAATWLELDEAASAGVHAAAHVLAPLLAVAQSEGLPGNRLLDGFVAGHEATTALYEQYPVTYPVHPHAGLATVGAATGLAVALGGDVLRTARVAATLPVVTTWDACFEGVEARHAFAGAASAAAVRASVLARAGIDGAAGALPTLYGQVLGAPGDAPAPPRLDRPRLLDSTIKRHAACLTCHTAIEAALRLPPVAADEIARVEVLTVPEVADKVDRQPAPNELSTKFSLPYAVANALVRRRSDPAAFAFDPAVAEVARRVAVSVDPNLPTAGHAMPASVTLAMRSGAEHTEEVLDTPGGPAAPMSDAELRSKFLAATGDPELFDALLAVDGRPDCRDLLRRPPVATPRARGDAALVEHAVALAAANARTGEHPFAAVVACGGQIVATGVNTAVRDVDPSAHAEVNAIKDACRRLGEEDLAGTTLYSSCEPCPTCHSLAALVGIERIAYAAPKEDAERAGFTMNAVSERMQRALRALDGTAVAQVETQTAGEPFEVYLAGRRDRPRSR